MLAVPRVCAIGHGLVLALAAAVFAPSAPAVAEQDAARLSGALSGEQALAAAEVRVENATMGDLFAAGGEVELDRVSAGDVIAAGGALRFRDIAVDDLIAAGGEVDIAGQVRDDLIAAGGRVRQGPGSAVAGYALLAGGDIRIDGRIDGNVKAAGGRIRLAGEVGGDMDLAAHRIVIEPGARIGGRLTYRASEAAEIAPDAVIAGGVERIEAGLPEVSLGAGIAIAIGVWLVAILGLGVLGAALHGMIPAMIAESVGMLGARPWAALGLGFAVLAATPVAANLLFMTIVGIPLGLFALAVYGVLLVPGLFTAAYWIGLRLGGAFGWAYQGEPVAWRILWTLLGLFVLAVIVLVPVLGFLLVILALALGLGAFVLRAWHGVHGQRFGGLPV